MRSSILFGVLILGILPLSVRSQARAASDHATTFHLGAEVQKQVRYYSVGSYELGLLAAIHDTAYRASCYVGMYGVFHTYNDTPVDSYSISIEAAPEIYRANWLWFELGGVGRINFHKYTRESKFETRLEYGGKLTLNVQPDPALWLQVGIGLLWINTDEIIGNPLGTINLRFLTSL